MDYWKNKITTKSVIPMILSSSALVGLPSASAAATAPTSASSFGPLQAFGLLIVTSTILFTYSMYYNVELQKTLPSGQSKYYFDGELIEFEFDNKESKYDKELAREYSYFLAMLKNKVWDIEYGPGGYIDVKWKRNEDGTLALPEKLTTYYKDFKMEQKTVEGSDRDLEIVTRDG